MYKFSKKRAAAVIAVPLPVFYKSSTNISKSCNLLQHKIVKYKHKFVWISKQGFLGMFSCVNTMVDFLLKFFGLVEILIRIRLLPTPYFM